MNLHWHIIITCLHLGSLNFIQGFPDSSVGKESVCNAGNPGLIPGLGRSVGEGIGYSLQCYWASLVAQLVKTPLAMWKTWVWFLSWENPLEKGKATHSNILAWVAKSWTWLSNFHFLFCTFYGFGQLCNNMYPSLWYHTEYSYCPKNHLCPAYASSSLVADMVKNLPAMWETQVPSLGGEVSLEKGLLATPVFMPREYHGQRILAGYSPWGHEESDITEQLT